MLTFNAVGQCPTHRSVAIIRDDFKYLSNGFILLTCFATILPYKHKGENTQVVIQATITRVTHDDSCCATAQRRLCLESVLSFRNINSMQSIDKAP